MKTLALALFLLWPIVGNAADYSFVKTGGGDISTIGTILDEAGLAYDRSGYLSPEQYGGQMISAVVTYTSTTFSNVSFSTNAITMGSANIASTAHGLTTGLAVLLSTNTGTVPGPLVFGTTYYAIRYSANIVQLATTSAQAIASDPIVLVSSTVTGTQTYVLSALAIGGTPSFKWQASNDGVSWADVNTSSITMSAYTLGGTTSAWDFEAYDFAILRLNAIAPTTGGIYLKAILNVKRNY